jgi:hypothetical protein
MVGVVVGVVSRRSGGSRRVALLAPVPKVALFFLSAPMSVPCLIALDRSRRGLHRWRRGSPPRPTEQS